MNWASFWGALAGSAVAVLAVIGILFVWDYVDRHRTQSKKIQKPSSLPIKDILESQLEQYVVENFNHLFPGWKVFNEPSKGTTQPQEGHKPLGIRYRTDAGEIDILAIDPQGTFVAIELKRDQASDKVSAQVDRYVAWIKKHLAKPGQKVRGLIIAKYVERRLAYTLLRRRGITIWTYEWYLKFNKRPDWKGATTNSSRPMANEIVESEIAKETKDETPDDSNVKGPA